MQQEVIIKGYDKIRKGNYTINVIPYGSKLIHISSLEWDEEKTYFVHASDLHKILSIERNNTSRILEILYDLYPYEYSYAFRTIHEEDDDGHLCGEDCPDHFSTTVIRWSNFMNILCRFTEDKTSTWNYYRANKLYRFMNKYYLENLKKTDGRHI